MYCSQIILHHCPSNFKLAHPLKFANQLLHSSECNRGKNCLKEPVALKCRLQSLSHVENRCFTSFSVQSAIMTQLTDQVCSSLNEVDKVVYLTAMAIWYACWIQAQESMIGFESDLGKFEKLLSSIHLQEVKVAYHLYIHQQLPLLAILYRG